MKRIGFDLHGVLNPHTANLKKRAHMFTNGVDGFRSFVVSGLKNSLERWRKKNAEIWVVSGPPVEQIRDELTKLGYVKGKHYDAIASVVDFLKEENAEMWLSEEGTWWASDSDWWSSKAKICKKHGISVLVDDKAEYKPFFEGSGCKFILYKGPK